MTEFLQANWILLAIAILIGVIVLWWVFVANRKTRVISTRPDVLEEGSAPARRNQALIDSPPPTVSGSTSPEQSAAVPEAIPVSIDTASTPPPSPVTPAVTAPATVIAAQAASKPMTDAADDLKRIKGLGPKLEKLLRELGINSFAQIAEWNEADIDRIDAQLGNFSGRIRRDNWVEQAKLLADGNVSGFEGRFGNL